VESAETEVEQYEYAYVARTVGANLRIGQPDASDRQLATSDRDYEILNALNDLGKGGWQLVGIASDAKHPGTFWLRRRLARPGADFR
jgi:hypothetical protein